MASLRVRDDPHLVVVAIFNTIVAMVLGSRSRGGGATRAVSGYRPAMFVRLRPLSRAVLLFHAASPSYGGMQRVSVLCVGRPVPGPRCWARAWGLSVVL